MLRAIRLCSWSELRARWRAWLGLALIVGVAGGTAMALATGARRTETAYPRFAAAQRTAHVVVAGRSNFGLVGSVDLGQIERFASVDDRARAFVALVFTGSTSNGHVLGPGDLFPVASRDTKLGDAVERWKILDGRAADPENEEEATASFVLAQRYGLHVGDTIDLHFFRSDSFLTVAGNLINSFPTRLAADDASNDLDEIADGPRVRLRIVGIEASPLEFPPLLSDLAPVMHLTPAFDRRYEDDLVGSPISYIRLDDPDELGEFQLAVERSANGRPVSFISTSANQGPKVERSIQGEAVALAILAGLLALAASVAIAQAVGRQTAAAAGNYEPLRALGMTESQRRQITRAPAIVVATVGSAVAVVVAVFGAQFTLLPLARKAELNSGPHADFVVLGVGVALILMVVLGSAWISARVEARAQRRDVRHAPPRGSARGLSIGATGVLPPTTAVGLRFALGRRVEGTIPAWTAMLAVGLSVAMMTGAVTFTTNLDAALRDEHRYGWNWTQKIGAPALPSLGDVVTPALLAQENVRGLSVGVVTQADVGDTRIDVLGLDSVRGDAIPTVLEGRAPTADDEIALGSRSLRRLHKSVGDEVAVRIGRTEQSMRIVGRAVFPEFGDAGQLGTGSMMTMRALKRLLPDAPTNTFMIQLDGSDDGDVDAAADHIATALAPLPDRREGTPDDLDNLARGDGLLVPLAIMLALLVFAVVVHALLTTVRYRRHDLAMLRTLGFARAQVAATVTWQGATLLAGSLLVGVPLGVWGGRRIWSVFAHDLGLEPAPHTAAGAIALVAAGTAFVSVLAWLVPAWLATRSRPSTILHTD